MHRQQLTKQQTLQKQSAQTHKHTEKAAAVTSHLFKNVNPSNMFLSKVEIIIQDIETKSKMTPVGQTSSK